MDPKGDKPRHQNDDYSAVRAFGDIMFRKLRENAYKAHWSTVDTVWLRDRLIDEVEELIEAIESGDAEAIQLECGDVANFAMMISDNMEGRK